MGFSALVLAQAARGAHPTGPPGLSRPEPVGPGQWSRTPPSGSSGGNRKQSTACPPRSLGGLWAEGGSAGTRGQTQHPFSGRRGTPASMSIPLSKAAKNFSPSNISTVSEGSGPRYRSSSRRRVASTWGAGDPLAGRPTPCTPPPAPQPSAAPTLLRGRHCSRTCSGSRRLCSAMRFTRYSRSRSQAFRARLPTQALVVYQSQYLGRRG